jgi:hypothetical protein
LIVDQNSAHNFHFVWRRFIKGGYINLCFAINLCERPAGFFLIVRVYLPMLIIGGLNVYIAFVAVASLLLIRFLLKDFRVAI